MPGKAMACGMDTVPQKEMYPELHFTSSLSNTSPQVHTLYTLWQRK